MDLYQPIIDQYYPEDTPLRRLLVSHSEQVCRKALEIVQCAPQSVALSLNLDVVRNGAMLHDIGIRACHAPSIYCIGPEPYIAHGTLGGQLLRQWGSDHGIDMEVYARICERHTGAGITAAEVQAQGLPIAVRDYLPETLEEKLVCLADKFFSKSSPDREKPLANVRHSMSKFGAGTVERFDALCRLFGLPT